MENLLTTIRLLHGEDGVLVSRLPARYRNAFQLPLVQGLHTGMLPGYFLRNLAVLRHPLAEAAFDAYARDATPTGTAPEYQLLDDHTPLQLLYDPVGGVGDYTARFRPWEGGINGEAMLTYLLGVVPEAAAGRLELAPQLPAGWSWLEARGIRLGPTHLDLQVAEEGGRRQVTVTHREGPGVRVRLVLPLPGTARVHDATQDDRPLDATNGLAVTALPWDTVLVRFPEQELAAGAEVRWAVGW